MTDVGGKALKFYTIPICCLLKLISLKEKENNIVGLPTACTCVMDKC